MSSRSTFSGIALAREAEAPGEPADVRVDGDALAPTERVAAHDGSRLAPHARHALIREVDDEMLHVFRCRPSVLTRANTQKRAWSIALPEAKSRCGFRARR